MGSVRKLSTSCVCDYMRLLVYRFGKRDPRVKLSPGKKPQSADFLQLYSNYIYFYTLGTAEQETMYNLNDRIMSHNDS